MNHRIRALSALSVVVVMSSAAAAQTPPPATPAPVAAPEATTPPPAPAPAPVLVEQPAPAPVVVVDAEPEAAPTKVGYEKGFFIESGDGNNRLVIGGRLQFRYTYFEVEDGPDSSAFSIERGRLKLEGHVITPDLTYYFQPEWAKGAVSVRDFFGDYRIAPNWLHFRAGQFYRPFSRQQITSDGNQELVDRAITDAAFGAGRDVGIMLHNNYEKSPELEYAVGLYNGTGERGVTPITVATDAASGDVSATAGAQSNVPRMFRPALVGRLGYNHGGIKGYSEVDLEGGDLRFGVGASGQIDFDADRSNDSLVKGELDAIVKVQGFSASGAGYVSSVQAGEGVSDRALGALGFHLQAGYLFAQAYQVAARFAVVAPDGDDDDQREIALVLGYLPFGHNLKWQTDLAGLSYQASNTTDARIRSQLQLAF